MERTILHCDCNAFFASVECVRHPEWKDVPMAVCGNPENRHGIILAKNELAKKYGIVTAETIWQAKRKCPDLLLVPPHHSEYDEYSERINKIYMEYTDRVEPFSVDESWLDLTGCEHLFGDGVTVADELRRRIREEIGITISVGVSFNKVFAKLGSDYKKPDATTLISKDNFKNIVWPLPVTELLYVGKSAKESLDRIGVHTIGDLAALGEERLVKMLGKVGRTLYIYANGLDETPVRYSHDLPEVKSVSNGMTFPKNLHTEEEIRAGILALSDSVASRLRKHKLRGYTVQIMLRFPDFTNISRQKTVEVPTCTATEITEIAMALTRQMRKGNAPIRMITVTVTGLTDVEYAEQMNLLDPEAPIRRKKREGAERAMDSIREKYGKTAVQFGAQLREENNAVD